MTKVTSKTMNEIVELLKSRGKDISPEDIQFLREKEVVSNSKRVSNSYQILDKNENYFRPQLSFKPVVPKTKLENSDLMNDMREDFKKLVKKYCEHITTNVSIPTVKSVSS